MMRKERSFKWAATQKVPRAAILDRNPMTIKQKNNIMISNWTRNRYEISFDIWHMQNILQQKGSGRCRHANLLLLRIGRVLPLATVICLALF